VLGSPVALFAGMVLFGAGFGVIENATFALLIEQLPEARASALWNLAYDAGYGAGPAVFGLICLRTGYPAGFGLTGVLILAAVPVAWRERKATRDPSGPAAAGPPEAEPGPGQAEDQEEPGLGQLQGPVAADGLIACGHPGAVAGQAVAPGPRGC